MKPAIADFLAIECKQNPTASRPCDSNAVVENSARCASTWASTCCSNC